jgi:hypothetical protein
LERTSGKTKTVLSTAGPSTCRPHAAQDACIAWMAHCRGLPRGRILDVGDFARRRTTLTDAPSPALASSPTRRITFWLLWRISLVNVLAASRNIPYWRESRSASVLYRSCGFRLSPVQSRAQMDSCRNSGVERTRKRTDNLGQKPRSSTAVQMHWGDSLGTPGQVGWVNFSRRGGCWSAWPPSMANYCL